MSCEIRRALPGADCYEPASRTLEWHPLHNRGSHAEAGNRGAYPHNDARRLQLCDACADHLLEADGEWCHELQSPGNHYSFRAIDVGFDLRVQGMPLVLPADASGVDYDGPDGEPVTVSGDWATLAAALADAGFEVTP